MHEKVVSIQIFQYLRQIPPRVCTLVLFIITGNLVRIAIKKGKSDCVIRTLARANAIIIYKHLKLFCAHTHLDSYIEKLL